MMVELFFCIAQIILIANCEYWGTPEIVYLHDIAKKEEIIFQNVLIPSPPQPFECTLAQLEGAIFVITRGLWIESCYQSKKIENDINFITNIKFM